VQNIDWVALIVFLVLFGLITWLGFASARWRRGNLDLLHEWGLGGRRFGTVVTWFLVGGDLYTAYTFIAVPALAFGAGALAFFAVPYTIIIWPLMFIIFPRLWQVTHKKGYITAADFVHGRFDNRWLALAVSVTGIVATMPYIALQLVGLQVVIGGLGIGGAGWVGELPLIFAFIILAAFTYSSGLRAPAAIAIVKDLLIYITAFAAVVIIPIQLGGFAKIFAAVPPAKLLLAPPSDASWGSFGVYGTLALGSAMALFLYPHSMTGLLSASSRHAVRRNAALLPSYSFLLGLLALLGFFALAAGVKQMPEFAAAFASFGNNFSVPALFIKSFPSWFVGLAFAAIGIGALVPAAIMSIAAANLFTRNIYRVFFHAAASQRQETQMAKWVSLLVKLGALIFVLWVPTQYAIQLQLLGGVWIVQTFPAVVFGLYTRWFNSWALLLGWLAGTVLGTWVAVEANFTPTWALTIGGYGMPGYTALYSVIVNIAVTILATLAFRALGSASAIDGTVPADYRP
jgi:SSS family solute:Na+ symporter